MGCLTSIDLVLPVSQTDVQATTLKTPYRNTLKGIYAATDGGLATYKGSNAFLYGAPSETRTRTLAHWLLRPACLPIPPKGQNISINNVKEQCQ